MGLGRNKQGQRIVTDVTQVTATGDPVDHVRTLCLWDTEPDDPLATPRLAPTGHIADLYRSAGLYATAATVPS